MGARVDVTWAGKRWSFDEVEIDVRGALSLDDNGFRGRRVSVDVDLGNAALLVSRGHHARTARVRIEVDGVLVLAAPVRAMTPGRAGELSTITCEEVIDPRASTIPSTIDVLTRMVDVDATRAERDRWYEDITAQREADLYSSIGQGPKVLDQFRISEDYWPTVWSETVTGRLYPIVVGRPGKNGVFGAPALPFDVAGNKLMVAGHRTKVGTVTIRGPKNESIQQFVTEVLTTSIEVDERGQEVTVVDVSSASDLASDWTGLTDNLGAEAVQWMCAWDGTAEGISGHPIDVIAMLLAHVQNVTMDWGSCEALRSTLAPYRLDTVIASEASAWDLLTQQVLPLLPVGLAVGPAGLGLVARRLEATAGDARLHLTEGPTFAAVERPRWRSEGETITNAWSVSYGPSRVSAGFGRSISVEPNAVPELARSASIHGLVTGTRQTPWIYDREVAGLVAMDLAIRFGIDRRTCRYEADTIQYGIAGTTPLRLGMVVTITHADEYLTDQLAIVWEIQYRGTRTDLVTLLMLEA